MNPRLQMKLLRSAPPKAAEDAAPIKPANASPLVLSSIPWGKPDAELARDLWVLVRESMPVGWKPKAKAKYGKSFTVAIVLVALAVMYFASRGAL